MDKPWIKYITMENLPNEDLNIVADICSEKRNITCKDCLY